MKYIKIADGFIEVDDNSNVESVVIPMTEADKHLFQEKIRTVKRSMVLRGYELIASRDNNGWAHSSNDIILESLLYFAKPGTWRFVKERENLDYCSTSVCMGASEKVYQSLTEKIREDIEKTIAEMVEE